MLLHVALSARDPPTILIGIRERVQFFSFANDSPMESATLAQLSALYENLQVSQMISLFSVLRKTNVSELKFSNHCSKTK